MLEKIKQLVNIYSYSYNQKNIELAINLCKSFYPLKYIKETAHNGFKSALFSNYDGFDFDVLSLCHIDIVECPMEMLQLKQQNNIIYGRGVFDMKSFLISSLENLYRLQKNIKYGVLITSDEEIGGENGAKYWIDNFNLKTKILLDCDDGYNLNTIVKKRYGTAMIDLLDSEENNLKFYNKNIKDKYYFTELKNKNEINIYFENEFNFKPFDKIKCNILQVNNPVIFNIKNNYTKKYIDLIEKHTNNRVIFSTSKNSPDSRYFYKLADTIIANQATGGDNHKPTEWLDFESLKIFNQIQWEFLNGL